jgi:hypothetical protein
MLQQCEERAQEELRKKRRDALAMGQSVNVIDEVKSAGLLKDWIHEEVRSQQQDILNRLHTQLIIYFLLFEFYELLLLIVKELWATALRQVKVTWIHLALSLDSTQVRWYRSS